MSLFNTNEVLVFDGMSENRLDISSSHKCFMGQWQVDRLSKYWQAFTPLTWLSNKAYLSVKLQIAESKSPFWHHSLCLCLSKHKHKTWVKYTKKSKRAETRKPSEEQGHSIFWISSLNIWLFRMVSCLLNWITKVIISLLWICLWDSEMCIIRTGRESYSL